ncbi:MAG TPA: TIGR04282 family arsenosugar biosynthesis glycosyltransferase [Blastocatellia bacterium]|nr:TIGR04282 family arsenosugar biosynthesis glycosyltransferase [Blastocatellia bacterium]
MAKTPRAGLVKTRLRPFLSDEQIVSLAVCFLQDVISTAKQVTPDIILAFAPPDGREMLESLFGTEVELIEQSGNDLGQRLEAVIKFAEQKSFSPIIVIGADSPTLPVQYLRQAIAGFDSEDVDVALGATRDGGFYLIGLRQSHQTLFDHISWSSEFVYQQTSANIERLGLSLFSLPDWYDIDTPDDLFHLRDEMLSNETSRQQATKTYQWFLSHSELFALR